MKNAKDEDEADDSQNSEDQLLDDEKEAKITTNQHQAEVMEEQKRQVADRNKLEKMRIEIQEEKRVSTVQILQRYVVLQEKKVSMLQIL